MACIYLTSHSDIVGSLSGVSTFMTRGGGGVGIGNEALRMYGWEDSTYWKHNNTVLFSCFESRGRLMRRKNVISWVNTEKKSVFWAVSPGFFPASVPFSLLLSTTIQATFSVLAPSKKLLHYSLGFLRLCSFPL